MAERLSPQIEAALQDPNLHTDARLLLRRQLIELLEHHDAVPPAAAPHAADDGELSSLVEAALTDPNVHTDERLALSHKVTELLRTASHP